jgi:hypothetical protein
VGDRPLIHFLCVRDDHRGDGKQKVSDHLTINEHAWAYCAKDVRLAEHQWEPTGGIPVQEIARFARTREERRRTPAAPGHRAKTSR